MKKTVLTMGIFLLSVGVNLQADELDEIKLVDESAKSALFQQGSIVGCSDDNLETNKELTCSKKPEEIILSKLPSSQQIEDADLDNKDESDGIKTQLQDILAQLEKLKQEQQADRETIKELKGVISVISNKNIQKPQKIAVVKKSIEKMSQKTSKNSTRIRQPVKEVGVYDNYVVIEVQPNESLSTYAQLYYNNNRKYYKIYKANKGIINENLQLVVGQQIKIPDAHSYKNN